MELRCRILPPSSSLAASQLSSALSGCKTPSHLTAQVPQLPPSTLTLLAGFPFSLKSTGQHTQPPHNKRVLHSVKSTLPVRCHQHPSQISFIHSHSWLNTSLSTHVSLTGRVGRLGYPNLLGLINSIFLTFKHCPQMLSVVSRHGSDPCIRDCYSRSHTLLMLCSSTFTLIYSNPVKMIKYRH